MKLIQKIKDIIFKVKDYDRIENDYSSVLDYATGGILSKTNYTLDSVYEGIQHNLQKHDEYVFMDFLEKAERYLKYTLYDRVEIKVFGTLITSIVSKKEFIDNFKKYMQDESEKQ